MKKAVCKRKSMVDYIMVVIAIICAIPVLWVFFSWINLVAHNLDTNPVYASWNFFVVFFG